MNASVRLGDNLALRFQSYLHMETWEHKERIDVKPGLTSILSMQHVAKKPAMGQLTIESRIAPVPISEIQSAPS
jgi:hypothetical protein